MKLSFVLKRLFWILPVLVAFGCSRCDDEMASHYESLSWLYNWQLENINAAEANLASGKDPYQAFTNLRMYFLDLLIYQEAIKYSKKALAIYPDYESGYIDLVSAYFEAKMPEDTLPVIRTYEAVILGASVEGLLSGADGELTKWDIIVCFYFYLKAYNMLGNVEKSDYYCDFAERRRLGWQLEETNYYYPLLLKEMSKYYASSDNRDLAIERYREATEFIASRRNDRIFPLSHYERGILAIQKGEFKEAVDFLFTIVEERTSKVGISPKREHLPVFYPAPCLPRERQEYGLLVLDYAFACFCAGKERRAEGFLKQANANCPKWREIKDPTLYLRDEEWAEFLDFADNFIPARRE